MAGRPGRSGRKPLFSIEQHVARGTYRRDRHGPLPIAGSAALAVTPATVPAHVLEGLGVVGSGFVRVAFAEYEFSALESTVLRVAAQCLDDAEAARGANDGKGARAAYRQFLAAMTRLGLPVWEKK